MSEGHKAVAYLRDHDYWNRCTLTRHTLTKTGTVGRQRQRKKKGGGGKKPKKIIKFQRGTTPSPLPPPPPPHTPPHPRTVTGRSCPKEAKTKKKGGGGAKKKASKRDNASPLPPRPPPPPIPPHTPGLSLVGAAPKDNFYHDKISVAINTCFVATKVYLSRQQICRNKIMFVATKT